MVTIDNKKYGVLMHDRFHARELCVISLEDKNFTYGNKYRRIIRGEVSEEGVELLICPDMTLAEVSMEIMLHPEVYNKITSEVFSITDKDGMARLCKSGWL